MVIFIPGLILVYNPNVKKSKDLKSDGEDYKSTNSFGPGLQIPTSKKQ